MIKHILFLFVISLLFVGAAYSMGACTGCSTCSSCDPGNLVPNCDFENYCSCPDFPGDFDNLESWSKPNSATSDFYHVCGTDFQARTPFNAAGSQVPRSGTGYAALLMSWDFTPEYREYGQVALSTTLSAISYDVSFYVSLGEAGAFKVDRMGAYFSSSPIGSGDIFVLNYVPQVENPLGNIISDETNWVKISGTFMAVGTEKYITIGNFRNDANTTILVATPGFQPGAYYYLDDVCVAPSGSGICSPALPIVLKDFRAEQVFLEDVLLSWTTSSEQNNDFFEIERSSDNVYFKSLGQVGGAGNTNVNTSYSFIDTEPLPGNNYYRLKQVDFDGKQSYNKIIAWQSENANTNVETEVFDLYGRNLSSDTKVLSHGIYVIKEGNNYKKVFIQGAF